MFYLNNEHLWQVWKLYTQYSYAGKNLLFCSGVKFYQVGSYIDIFPENVEYQKLLRRTVNNL